MHDAWRLFMAMATQWKTAGMAGVRTGLDYGVIPGVAASLQIDYPLKPEVFGDLRFMEAEAMAYWSQPRGKL